LEKYMPLIIPDSYCQVVLSFDDDNSESGLSIVTLALRYVDPVTLEDIAGAVAGSWESSFATRQVDACTLSQVLVFTETQAFTGEYSIQGEASASQCPPNVTLLVQKQTSVRGPRAKGRFYPPGMLPESEVDDAGQIQGATVTAIQALADGFYDGVTAGAASGSAEDMVILQNSEGQSPPLSPPPLVSGLAVASKVATQRGRLR
jgi:hypothetical protein